MSADPFRDFVPGESAETRAIRKCLRAIVERDPADPMNVVSIAAALEYVAAKLDEVDRNLRAAFEAIGP